MKKLLNFGSLNIDYTYAVKDIVLSGETIKASDMQTNIGGKGLNQSVAFAKAGGCVFHAGKIGKDGLFLKEYLDKNHVNTDYVDIGNTSSGHAIIQVDEQGHNCIIIYGGANREITTQYIDKVLSDFTNEDVLLLQNEINNIDYIVKKAHEKGMFTVLNPSPVTDLDVPLEYIDCFILNEHEAEAIFKTSDVEELIIKMKETYPKACFVLTLGSKGAIYIDQEQTVRVDAVKTKAVDTTAAGDTFTGYFLNSVMTGNDPKSALELAAKAAAITVSKNGAAESIPMYYEI